MNSDSYEHIENGVYYCSSRVPGKGCSELFDNIFTEGCSCSNDCISNTECICLKMGVNYKRSDDLLFIVPEKLNLPVFECHETCQCSINCSNRYVQYGPCQTLVVFKTPNKGFGVQTTKKIFTGQFVCEYAGEVIGEKEAKEREIINERLNKMNYIFELKENSGNETISTWVDPSVIGNIGRYMNHSCDPNCAVVPVRVDSPVPLLCLFAIRDIEIGEEVTFDYSGGNNEETNCGNLVRKPCFCTSKNCKLWLPFNK